MKKILVIEDEPTVRANLLKLLDIEGYQSLEASDGHTGIQLAEQHQPDLILCDIMMPELDGYAVLEALRQNPATAMIPFIFLTAKAERNDWRQGMEKGADDYLTKPFTRSELLAAITMRLQRQEAALQQFASERERSSALMEKCAELEQFIDAKDELLNNLSHELRQPLSNINLAIHMLKEAPPGAQRDRYLEILQKEFAREIALLNQVSELQQFLTPESVKLLSQFKLLKSKTSKNFL
ncbi:response regulator [Desertifilum sp. FACHB-1129]|uniref:histidine kinase n=1 Tax=Desertifilum tharense IPPAS B-1220 TaxID=1781255 RepID=A0A1E5QCK4_9CYAN|nr:MULTISPECIES: response regulator [Desertifilum]MDA0210831.1 response regulator [Cyanobacteria bacterium FC1]MBD2312317.1 response regulator [Desertifilum sp. FACHB-1129]MBD2322275.1 response regulator [Desertifilum sp. FACHB-866]MBD2332312.1 response regulator [Desertifilum sp. FACHB-868]OEJ72331.1 response regulator receiver protein [Desertifilum tharense IPPAS B-1220]